MSVAKEYALYKGDEFIGIGTIKELAALIGISEKSMSFMRSPSYKRRIGDSTNAKILVPLDDKEDE